MNNFLIKCIDCGQVEKNSIVKCSSCHGALETVIIRPLSISRNEKCDIFSRFRCFFSVSSNKVLKQFPGTPTPIINLDEKSNFAKLEYCSLSLSAKDREAFIEIMMAKEMGYKGIIAASTGNMGAALSALCALFSFPCHVYVPTDTAKIKIQQIKQFGANVHKIDGNYDTIVLTAREISKSKNLFLASLQAFRFDGYKSISYEIYETFGAKLPQNIIVPVGDGTTYVAIYKGFKDLVNLGLIKTLPRMIGVQGRGSDPVVESFKNNHSLKTIDAPKTIAKAIRIGRPLDGDYAIKVAHETSGEFLSYSDEEIIKACMALNRLGINAEYASAAAYGPILFNKYQNSLVIITGSGLKN